MGRLFSSLSKIPLASTNICTFYFSIFFLRQRCLANSSATVWFGFVFWGNPSNWPCSRPCGNVSLIKCVLLYHWKSSPSRLPLDERRSVQPPDQIHRRLHRSPQHLCRDRILSSRKSSGNVPHTRHVNSSWKDPVPFLLPRHINNPLCNAANVPVIQDIMALCETFQSIV